MRTELEQTRRNLEIADKVNALLTEAAALSINTTRRQARKMLQGRGRLGQRLREARAAKAEAEGR